MSVAAIRLTPRDNVAVCCRTVEPGEHITVDGHDLLITERVALGHKLAVTAMATALGHKLAVTAMATGDKVIKYGMPIGSMTHDAPAGGWVHMHNMKSDYMPAHLRDAHGDHA